MGLVIDIIILIICAFFSVRAFFRGFLSEVLSLLAFVVGTLLAKHLSPFILSKLPQSIAETIYAPILVYSTMFLLGYIAMKVLDKQFSKVINLILLSGLNKVLGILFGIVEGLVILLIVVYILRNQTIIEVSVDTYLAESRLLAYVEGLFEVAKSMWVKS